MPEDISDDEVPCVRTAHRFIKRCAFEPLPDMGINVGTCPRSAEI